jgi:hypothetical protein
MQHVNVVVTGKVTGFTLVAPYNHIDGLQMVVIRGKPTDQAVAYKVPKYEVRVEGGSSYDAVRFGLRNKGTTPKVRGCDAGLSHWRVCTPGWVGGYSPHSFNGSSRPGAWQLLPHRGFLIHEGANSIRGQIGGSIGCIEILDGDWNAFLGEVESLAGTNAKLISSKGLLRVLIEYAPYPNATLAE